MTNSFGKDLKTNNTDRVRPINTSFYRLCNLAAKYNNDLTQDEVMRCREGTLVNDGDNCFGNALEFLLKFDGVEREISNKNCWIEFKTSRS